MVDSLIAPLPPSDGRDWDCQCARCGSSAGYVDAEDGGIGLYVCLSHEDWCKAHPIKGRESMARGEIEWFEIPPAKGAPQPAPPSVWVYWCRNCGEPILADAADDCEVDCPHCPIGRDQEVGCARYEVAGKDGAK